MSEDTPTYDRCEKDLGEWADTLFDKELREQTICNIDDEIRSLTLKLNTLKRRRDQIRQMGDLARRYG